MATITTTITPDPDPFQYQGLGDSIDSWASNRPSAEVLFLDPGSAVTKGGVADDQRLLIQCFLPRSFAWVLTELNFRMTATDANDWDSVARAFLQDGTAAPSWSSNIRIQNDGVSHNSSLALTRSYFGTQLPKKVVIPSADDGLLEIKLFNVNLDGVAATIQFFARFLRYDLNQAYLWGVNTPALIR